MKKYIIIRIAAVAGLMSARLHAGDANQMHYVYLGTSQNTNATTTGTAVDISAYKGNGTFVFSRGDSTVTNQAVTVTIQHSAVLNFATYATVTNISGTAGVMTFGTGTSVSSGSGVLTFPCDTGRLRKYVRAVYAQSVPDESAPVSVLFVAPFKSQ